MKKTPDGNYCYKCGLSLNADAENVETNFDPAEFKDFIEGLIFKDNDDFGESLEFWEYECSIKDLVDKVSSGEYKLIEIPEYAEQVLLHLISPEFLDTLSGECAEGKVIAKEIRDHQSNDCSSTTRSVIQQIENS